MVYNVSLLLVVLFAATSLCRAVQVKPVKKSPAESSNDFGLELYAKLKYDPKFRKTNIFFSPLSITSAMGMVHLGARGKTAAQMEQLFSWDRQTVNSDFKKLGQTLASNNSGFVLRLANRIWGQQGMTILRSFLNDSDKYFGATMAQADFVSAHEQARQEINRWVENKTDNKITELIKLGTLDPSTRMVLCNAIYFKGTWKYQFDKNLTHDTIFYMNRYRRKGRKNKLQVPIQMMKQKNFFKYYYDRDSRPRCHVLELPYVGGQTSMFIVLPRRHGSRALRRVAHQMTPLVIKRWVDSVSERKLEVFLPKFKVGHTFEANDYLKSLGVTDLFSGSDADLSGVTGSRDLSVTKVVHKAFVEVNEEGTEAAASTGVFLGRSRARTFRADRPFLYFVYHKTSGAILFLGRVMNPKQESVV